MPVARILGILLTLVLVAAGGSALAGAGETPAAAAHHPPQRFADRLAAELSLPAAQVRDALQAARTEVRAQRRAKRAERRAKRAERRRLRGGGHGLRPLRRLIRVRDRLGAALAAKLNIEPAKVTAALRSLLAQRLDRAVGRGRLAAGDRDAVLACFDDASKCQGLRARLRHP
jgi:hypothetical protein